MSSNSNNLFNRFNFITFNYGRTTIIINNCSFCIKSFLTFCFNYTFTFIKGLVFNFFSFVIYFNCSRSATCFNVFTSSDFYNFINCRNFIFSFFITRNFRTIWSGYNCSNKFIRTILTSLNYFFLTFRKIWVCITCNFMFNFVNFTSYSFNIFLSNFCSDMNNSIFCLFLSR